MPKELIPGLGRGQGLRVRRARWTAHDVFGPERAFGGAGENPAGTEATGGETF
jgi:hypothetical protein